MEDKIFIVSDVHGFTGLLIKTLVDRGFDIQNPRHILLICGDAFDRGEEACAMQQFLSDLLQKNRLIYIRGNHDDLIEQMMDEIVNGKLLEIASGLSHHYLNGTWGTALQLASMSEIEALQFPNAFIDRILQSDLFEKILPNAYNWYEIGKYIFVHGFVPVISRGWGRNCRYSYKDDWRSATKYEWEQARWLNGIRMACEFNIKEPNKIIVVGHYHCSYGYSKIEHTSDEWGENANFSPYRNEEKGIIAIDACTAETGKINCLVIGGENYELV